MPAHPRTTPVGAPHGQRIRAVILASCAGTLLAPWAIAQVVAPAKVAPPEQPPLVGVFPPPPQPILGALRAYTDEAVLAKEALARAAELMESGNPGEAARVLQGALDKEATQVLPTAHDPDLYRAVRDTVHDALLASPELLAKYRAEMNARAQEMLDTGDAQRAEQTRFLTTAGFEAALRIAQLEFEAGRFESAAFGLAALRRHPDRNGQGSERARALALDIARALPREDTLDLARVWGAEPFPAGANLPAALPASLPAPLPAALTPPFQSRERAGRDGLSTGPAPDWEHTPRAPLQSLALQPTEAPTNGADTWENRAARPRGGAVPWVFPAIEGRTIFVNDGGTVRALDADTLALLWSVTPPNQTAPRTVAGYNVSRALEDVSGVAVARGIVVAATGLAMNTQRAGDPRVHALSAEDGTLLWSVDPSYIDPRLQDGAVRGIPVIVGDTVVLAVRKVRQMRSLASLYLVGLDLPTGTPLWIQNVGSVGMQAWGRTAVRPETAVAHRGLVYRGDAMGLLGAYDAATGRPAWVRRSPATRVLDANSPVMMAEEAKPFELCAPVVLGGNVYFLDPQDGAVSACDAGTGELVSRRVHDGLEPRYILPVGDASLALVGRAGVTIVPLSAWTALSAGEKLVAPSLKTPIINATGTDGFTGRLAATASGTILAPVESGVLDINPSGTANPVARSLETTGNLLLVPGESPADSGHAVIASGSAVSTMLSWDKAESRLRGRLQREQRSATPALTYLELALRMGKPEHAPDMAKRVLALVEKDPTNPLMSRARTRLFELLLEALRASRVALAPANADASKQSMVVRDPAILDELEKRASLAAEEPGERARVLLERSALREQRGKHAMAADALQELLADDSLGSVVLTAREDGTLGVEEDSPARLVATSGVVGLVLRHGAPAYAAFDEEAGRALALIPANAPSTSWEALAQRYPASGAASAAWFAAAASHEKIADARAAVRALSKGLEASRLSIKLGRTLDASPFVGALGTLGALAPKASMVEPLARHLASLAADVPESSPARKPLMDVLGALRTRLENNPGLPEVGLTGALVSQVLEGWEPVEPLAHAAPGCATAGVVLSARTGDTIGFFGVDASSGMLVKAWEREGKESPSLLRVAPEFTVLYWPNAADAHVECVSNVTGSTLWRTKSLGTLVALADEIPANGAANAKPGANRDLIQTPLDGAVRPDDVIFLTDTTTLTLVERRGRAAAFNLADGAVLWSKKLPTDRVFDIDQTPAGVVIVGAGQGVDPVKPEFIRPIVLSIEKRDGHELWRVVKNDVIGEYARWARGLGDGGAIVSCAKGIVRINPSGGSAAWQADAPHFRAAVGSWVVGGSLFVLDGEFGLRLLNLADGTGGVDEGETLDDRERISLPFDVHTMQDHLAICSGMGLVTFAPDGTVLGADGLDGKGKLEPARPCVNSYVTVQTLAAGVRTGDALNAARIVKLAAPGGVVLEDRELLLHTAPTGFAVLDGKVLVGQGPFTLVIDTPRK